MRPLAALLILVCAPAANGGKLASGEERLMDGALVQARTLPANSTAQATLFTESLVLMMQNDEGAVRANAAWALGELRHAGMSFGPILQNAMDNDPDARVRANAASALAKTSQQSALPLLQAARDPRESLMVRASAVVGLGRLGLADSYQALKDEIKLETSMPRLARELRAPDPAVSDSAMNQLIQARRPAIPYLAALLRDKDAAVKRKALDAIIQIPARREAAGALVGALKDIDLHYQARFALLGIGDAAVPSLEAAVQRGNVRDAAAVNTLYAINTPLAAAALGRTLSHPDPELAALALNYIGLLAVFDKAGPAVPYLAQALDDPALREEATRTLARIGSPAAREALKR